MGFIFEFTLTRLSDSGNERLLVCVCSAICLNYDF